HQLRAGGAALPRSLEGADHDRIRRLLVPAFSPKLIRELTPRFEDLADELVDGFAQHRPDHHLDHL
ncbi:MAG: hypothetical protein J2P19_14695, partial [Pseudonocardia sp.]|nr:hypothetical protein [Pseudonocardia sp.]